MPKTERVGFGQEEQTVSGTTSCRMWLCSVMSLLTTRGRGVDHDVRETTDTE